VRTLYRHYPTRTALLEALWSWVNARLGMPPQPRSAREYVAQVALLFDAFEQDEVLVRAMLHDPNGRAARLRQVEARRKRARLALGRELSHLKGGERDKVLAAAQLLSSAAAWESMKDNWNLSGAQAASASQGAIGALLDSVRRTRKGPGG
jgi:hypothetical protein